MAILHTVRYLAPTISPARSGRSSRLSWPAALALAAIAALLPACAGPDNTAAPELRAEGSELFSGDTAASPDAADPPQAGNTVRTGTADDREQWVIGLRRVGAGADRQTLIETLRQRTGMGDLRIERRVGGEQLITGGWDSLANGRAAERLEEIREIEIDGQKPFQGAVLLPPTIDPATGANAAWDLRNAAETTDATITLQLEQFQPEADRPTRQRIRRMRRRAEDRAAELRRQNIEAFFYHTPTSSAITLGLFNENQIDTNPTPGFSPRHAPRVKELLERFPTQFFNGEPTDPPLPTTPVRIPG